MKKTAILILALLFLVSGTAFAAVGKDTKGPFGYNLYDDITRNPDADSKSSKSSKGSSSKKDTKTQEKEFYGDNTEAAWEKDIVYYPNANLNSAVNKYQTGNYSGCLQEMISLTKTDSANPLVYYYLGLAYTQTGNKDQAVKAYEKVIKLDSDKTLKLYATKGRDCLVGGPTCIADATVDSVENDIEKLLQSVDNNGFSDELNKQVKEQKLRDIQKTINNKQELELKDIQKIQEFDGKSEVPADNKSAENISDQEILSALETLKKAGITISVNPYQQTMPNQYNELSLLLGGNNNNNNAMMNMLPYMLAQNGQNIDPQILQTIMMNSMLPDFTFGDKDKKY